MAFNEKLPKWDNVGVEPPESKKTEGWQPTEKPPAQWFNWIFNRIYKTLEEIRTKAVEKETGKGLSTNDYTTVEKTKLADIEIKANKTVIANNLTETVVGKALDATQGKVLNDSLVAHKAESVSCVLEIIRETSLTGVQKISLPFKARSIIINASIDSTSISSAGFWAEIGGQKVKANSENNIKYSDGVAVFLYNSGVGEVKGIISNVVDDGFDMTWTNTAGGIGVANLFILVNKHGEV